MFGLINFAVNILMIGLVVHWIMGFIGTSHREEVAGIKAFLDRIYNPMLDTIRTFIKPLTLSDGRQFDLSPLLLFFGLAILRRFAMFLF